MITAHGNIELALFIGAALICLTLLLAKVVLLAYREVRNLWREIGKE